MKLALCFSGQPRYLRECFDSIFDKLLIKYQPSIFSSFWWDDSYIGQPFKFHATDKYEENNLELFKKYYGGTIEWQPQINFDISKYDLESGEMSAELSSYHRELWSKEVIFKQLSMYFSAARSFQLLLNSGEQFDLVVRLRTDLLFTKDIDLSKYLDDQIHIDDFENKSQLCDWFAVGTPACMTNYFNTYFLIDEICQNKVIRSTTLLRESLNRQKAPWQINDFGVNIFRGYKEPKHMDSYNESDKTDFPYWMK